MAHPKPFKVTIEIVDDHLCDVEFFADTYPKGSGTARYPRDEIVQWVRTWLEEQKPRPTIAELEALLATEDNRPITIRPDGRITAA